MDASKAQTAAEIAAGVMPVTFMHAPGSFQRYGMEPSLSAQRSRQTFAVDTDGSGDR